MSSQYMNEEEIRTALGDNSLMSQFDMVEPNPQVADLGDLVEDIGSFFTNTGKSAANANKITERLNKNLEKSFPFILAAGVIIGAMAITQTVKNVQEIKKNSK